jgi:hypothetical protein
MSFKRIKEKLFNEDIYFENFDITEFAKNSLDKSHMLLGGKRAGKTTLLGQLLYAICSYHLKKKTQIFIFLVHQTKQPLDIITSILKPFKEYRNAGSLKLATTTDPEQTETILQDWEKNGQIGPTQWKYIFIYDDCVDYLVNKKNRQLLIKLSSNQRHWNITTIFTAQVYEGTPTALRSQLDTLMVCKLPTIYSTKTIAKSTNFFKHSEKVIYKFLTKKLVNNNILIFDEDNIYIHKVPFAFIKNFIELYWYN